MNFMKVASAPLCGMLSCVSIENSEEALTSNVIEVNYKGMCVFHCSSRSFVLRQTNTKGWMVRGMTV